MTACVAIERVHAVLADRLRAYTVRIDGQEVGVVVPGGEAAFDVSEGSHTVQLFIDWGRSQEITIDLGPEETAHFRCAGTENTLLSMYRLVFDRFNYVTLERIDAPRST